MKRGRERERERLLCVGGVDCGMELEWGYERLEDEFLAGTQRKK